MAAAVARSLGNDAYNLLNYCAFVIWLCRSVFIQLCIFSVKVLNYCLKLSNGCNLRVSMLRLFHLLCVRLTLGIDVASFLVQLVHVCVCVCVCVCY